MTPRIVRLSLAVFLAATVFRSDAQPPPGPLSTLAAAAVVAGGNDPIVDRLTLIESSVDTVLEKLSEYTGRSILSPGTGLPPGKYTIDRRNIRRSELISALETQLAMNGVAIVPLDDRFMKVVPTSAVRTEAPELITGSTLGLPRSGRIATKLFQLDFLQAAQFVAAIQNLLNVQLFGPPAAVPSANAVLITDTLTNLQQVERLMIAMDGPLTLGTMKTYTLQNGARASDVDRKIRAAFGNTFQQQIGASGTFSSDDRTNQLFLIADARLHPVFDALIEKLDIKADPNTRTEVIPLKHADAAKVQELINTLIKGAAAQRTAAQSVRPGQGPAQQPNFPGPQNIPAQPGGLPGQPGGIPPGIATLPVVQPPANQAISGVDGAGASAEFSSIVNVVNDPRANSIIVSGTVDDVRLIRDLVAKIDTLLPQVRIEVIIAEVTLTDTDKSGISKLNLTVGTDTPAGAGGDNGRGTHITNFAGTIAGWDVTSGIVNPLSFAAAFSDAGARSNLKVLQAPTIVTTHAREGTVTVGSEIPYISNATSSLANQNDSVNQSVTFKQINLVLKVTPLIGDDGSIQLDIDQLIQDQIGSVMVNGNPTPQVGTRQVHSYVNVFDNQMIVLGGLQRTSLTNARDKLGFIYEIPILSRLLGNRTLKTERTELLLFIRPHVLKPEDGTADTNKTIETLSNKEQVKQYLADPGKPAKNSVLERIR